MLCLFSMKLSGKHVTLSHNFLFHCTKNISWQVTIIRMVLALSSLSALGHARSSGGGAGVCNVENHHVHLRYQEQTFNTHLVHLVHMAHPVYLGSSDPPWFTSFTLSTWFPKFTWSTCSTWLKCPGAARCVHYQFQGKELLIPREQDWRNQFSLAGVLISRNTNVLDIAVRPLLRTCNKCTHFHPV